MPRLLLLLCALAVAACGDEAETDPTAVSGGAELTTADAVADAVLERYDANVGAVDGFVVRSAGLEARYVPSDDTTGLDRFGSPDIQPIEDAPVAPDKAQLLLNHVPNGRRLARGLRTAELGGTVTRDGRRAYLLQSSDPGMLIGEPGLSAELGLQTRVYVDAETFDVLEIYRGIESDTTGAVTGRIIYSDFREADGLRLPYRVREVTTGLNGAMDSDTRMVMGGQLSLQKRQLEAAPASPERDERLAQVNAQLRMLNEGVLENEVVVESVEVPEAE
ncbi:hypothetical protein [Rubrivirga sp.]|uniref:hypothetical protein n=1 Tax=Rubrivirga sp. TaxID=1885344 RepID=UPI003C76E185